MENNYHERYYLSLWYYGLDWWYTHRHQTNENEIFSTKIITQVLTFLIDDICKKITSYYFNTTYRLGKEVISN